MSDYSTREVSNWQMGDKYFDYLKEKIQTIDTSLIIQNYDLTFNELSQIFYHLHKVIENNKKTEGKKAEISNQIEKIIPLLTRYDYLLISTTMPSYVKSKKIIAIKTELKKEIIVLYMLITGILEDLNMLLPKTRKSEGPQIYQQ